MPMIRAMRLLNAAEAGTLSGAQLEALLTADPGRLAELNVLLGMRGQARRMAASSTAMAAVIASSTAMAAVAASSTAMAAVAASSTAMAAVAASSTAMAAVAASKAALLACWNSETALTSLRSSAAAMTALLASPFKSTVGATNPSNLTNPMVAGKTILLRSYSNSGGDTNYLRERYANGALSGSGDYTYNTSTSYSTQMLAFSAIRHYNWNGNYTWHGDVVKVD